MYRIYTADINRDEIESILQSFVDGYTLIPASGAWKGIPEKSLVIELCVSKHYAPIVKHIAQRICQLNKQEAVMVQWFKTSEILVTK
jgi:hypothetical protein